LHTNTKRLASLAEFTSSDRSMHRPVSWTDGQIPKWPASTPHRWNWITWRMCTRRGM